MPEPRPQPPARPTLHVGLLVLALAALWPGCGTPRRPPAEPSVPGVVLPPSDVPPEDELTVTPATEPFTVAAWAEPARLPPLGGQSQIIVRVMRRGGIPFAGVEVRLQTSKGSLYSAGRTLLTDATGKTRDRLTARGDATITLNAGGTRYRFEVPLAEPLPLPE
jgi:hypothetical protein